MNEKAELSDLAGALLRGRDGAPRKNESNLKIAEYAATIFGLSVHSISQELFHGNESNIMIYFKGFIKFCSVAVGLSDDDCTDAFEIFFVEITGVPHRDCAMTFSVLDRLAKEPKGVALMKAGQMAAFECQKENTSKAIKALRKSLSMRTHSERRTGDDTSENREPSRPSFLIHATPFKALPLRSSQNLERDNRNRHRG